MVHKRSFEAQQKREAKRLLGVLNFNDQDLAEVIQTVTEQSINEMLEKKFGFVLPKVGRLVRYSLEGFELGEIRVDARGRGSLQQAPPPLLPRFC